MNWDEAAAQIEFDKERMTKNEWKRRVRSLMAQSKLAQRPQREPVDLTRAVPGKKAKEVAREVCIVVDCSFDALMRQRHIVSLSFQIRDSFGFNRNMRRPCRFIVSCPENDGECTRSALANYHDANRWAPFELSDKSYLDLGFERQNLIYLTSDAQEALEDIPDKSVLIVGGLIDRNERKGCTLEKAGHVNIRACRLPLDQVAVRGGQMLTSCHVVEIVTRFLELRDDANMSLVDAWKMSIEQAIPKRRLKE